MARTFTIKSLSRRFFGADATMLIRLVSINVLVFVVLGIFRVVGPWAGMNVGWTVEFFSLSSPIALMLTRFWTLLTYMFTHYDVWHILFNMLWLWWFGEIFLLTLSQRQLLLTYLFSGLAGALLFLGFYNLVPAYSDVHAVLSGASAGVLGIMTVAAFRSPDYQVRLFLIGNVKLKWIALVCIGLAFLGIGGGNTGGEAAHIGGVLFGAAYALSLRKGRDWFRKPVRNSADPAHNPSARRLQKAAGNYRNDVERLDTLLDKISLSGYASLSSKEKNELNELSKKLNKEMPK